MLINKETPPTSKEDADARRVRPSPQKFDPDKLSHWSITMTVAWIAWKTIDAVRNEWDAYRNECGDWIFLSDPAARARAERILISRLSAKGRAKRAALPRRLQKGSWRFHQWNRSGWNRLFLEALSKNLSPQVAIDEVWLAAGEGRLQAIAIECENAKTFDGPLFEIPANYWARLNRADELSGKPMLSGLGRAYRDVQFRRSDVKNLWPSADHPRKNDAQHLIDEQASMLKFSDPAPGPPTAAPAQAVPKTRRHMAEAKIGPEFEDWRKRQPTGIIPTMDDDFAHMRQFGVTRDTVRELRKKHDRMPRGRPRGGRMPMK